MNHLLTAYCVIKKKEIRKQIEKRRVNEKWQPSNGPAKTTVKGI
jgi:hypothetical protein